MSPFVPSRIDTAELLDEHDAPWDEMTRSLRDLRRINHWAGGIRIYERLIRLLLGRRPADGLTLVDLGTGTSDLPALAARRHGIRSVGLDFKIEHLLYGRLIEDQPVDRICGDATQLPFLDGSVDIVASAHFFHHFSPDQNRAILNESLRIARYGVIVNDTRRHWAPLFFVKMLGWLRVVGPITRFDAPASVRRGYTSSEIRSIASGLPVRRSKVVHVWPYRAGLLLWK